MDSQSLPDGPAAVRPRGAVAIIANRRGQLLMHLRDDFGWIAWPNHWSLLGGGCDPGETPGEAIVRELAEEADLVVPQLSELFELTASCESYDSGQILTFFAARWDGDETALPLSEGVKVQFFDPEQLARLDVPPLIRDGIHRYLAAGIR
ncbi:NUDIX hydrolase [Kitasatospora viridis]|uniref:8-oxo-dGTP diphosphatase n=1 Tax=Kitasatospora viridis TaxID=281105 RepID=A0A561T6D4_9ACTN|nr:NUDIX domain-containing protein [Kitasatospora viridis]TWF82676.1 8-oxo-dGTP diphosphatase [Kitasatospora viridis]